MKPSERIKQIEDEVLKERIQLTGEFTVSPDVIHGVCLFAIKKYLNEQHAAKEE